jgi:hypothetical protein
MLIAIGCFVGLGLLIMVPAVEKFLYKFLGKGFEEPLEPTIKAIECAECSGMWKKNEALTRVNTEVNDKLANLRESCKISIETIERLIAEAQDKDEALEKLANIRHERILMPESQHKEYYSTILNFAKEYELDQINFDGATNMDRQRKFVDYILSLPKEISLNEPDQHTKPKPAPTS